MSDSVAKYHDLVEQGRISSDRLNTIYANQASTQVICEIMQAATTADLVQELLNKVLEISKQGPNLTPSAVFQLAADVVKVDELCNKIK
jgi:hypothetical protein